MPTPNLSEEVKKSIQIAQALAKENSNANFSPSHLLRAMLHKELSLREFLDQSGKDFYFMEDWADVRIESYAKATKVDDPSGDDKVKDVFNEAENVRVKLSRDEVDLVCVFAAICTPGIAFSYDQLKTFPATVAEVLSSVVENTGLQKAIGGGIDSGGKAAPRSGGALLKFCIDKSELALNGKLDPIIGREKECRMISEILGRKSKPNVIITGDPGVGKTALVNGFVNEILSGRVPENLKAARVFELDSGAFIAGASYKGEAEDRMKNIINEIKGFEKAVLFVDNIHTLIDKNGATPGLGNILKPELAKGDVTVIGVTTNDNYRKFIEVDETFNRLFELVKVEEPDETVAIRMVQTAIPAYEEHHKIKLEADVIPESIRLSKRYLKERCLPDSAIDLIDRTMSAIKMISQTSKAGIESVKSDLDALVARKMELSEEDFLKELQWLSGLLKNRVSSVLFSQIGDESVPENDAAEAVLAHLSLVLDKLNGVADTHRDSISKTDIAAVVAHKTGIPLGKLQSQEREKLMNMDGLLRKRVVGQDHAIKAICEAILESRSGLSKPGQPIGSFFMLGPTGTGKTELAKSLAEFLFNDETALIRFDMSEFKEEHSAALLYGAPPGYVGYEEGGLLVNKIRQQPYAVVLFDEIEKAHPSVFDLFLQIMDEGKLHDRLGKEGDFSNSVILFTSNVGSDYIVESFGKGEIPPTNQLMDIMTRFFRPEFLARLTEIIPFSPITEKIVVNIFQIQLNGFLKILNRQGIQLKIDDKAKEFLAMSGFTPKYGARPISGVIRNQIRRPMSRKIISGEYQKGDIVSLSMDDNSQLVWKVEERVLA